MERGKGAFFHPPINIIDVKEEPDLKQPVSPKTRTVKFIHTKNSIKLIVTYDGFIGVIMDGSDEVIIELLNVLIATIMTKGQRALFVSENDLCDFEFDFDKNQVSILGSQVFSLRNRFEFERDNDCTYSLWAQTPRDVIHMKTMGGFFDQAHSFYQNIELRNFILLLAESWGLAYEKLFKASFLYSWMIIETAIDNFMIAHIDSLSISESEKKILKKNTDKISQSIKLLHQINKIDDETFNSLEKLREIRNRVTHNITTRINTDEAHNCMHVANEIIYNKFNSLPSPFVNITFVR